jgi:hypothetical protein
MLDVNPAVPALPVRRPMAGMADPILDTTGLDAPAVVANISGMALESIGDTAYPIIPPPAAFSRAPPTVFLGFSYSGPCLSMDAAVDAAPCIPPMAWLMGFCTL